MRQKVSLREWWAVGLERFADRLWTSPSGGWGTLNLRSDRWESIWKNYREQDLKTFYHILMTLAFTTVSVLSGSAATVLSQGWDFVKSTAGGGQASWWTSWAHRTPLQKTYWDQNVSSARAEKSCSVFAKGKSPQHLVQSDKHCLPKAVFSYKNWKIEILSESKQTVPLEPPTLASCFAPPKNNEIFNVKMPALCKSFRMIDFLFFFLLW